ncbi:MAG: YtxH domain-containing protein [Fibrobacter sp.]|nr:YtxH domain-containing protein [Fibrobacter sp.]
MNTFFRVAIGVVLGAVAGFVYHKTIGCSTGSCPITANPWSSMAYGAVFGAVITGIK